MHQLELCIMDVICDLRYITWFSMFLVGRVSVAVRTLDSQLRDPMFESSCTCFKTLAILFTPRCRSSLSCINEYLATDRGGHVSE